MFAASFPCLIAVSAIAPTWAQKPQSIAVVLKNKGESGFGFELVEEPPSKRSAAAGIFANELNATGWGILDVETNSAFSDLQQAFAAGVVEGYLTASNIYTTQANMYPVLFGENVSGLTQVNPQVIEFMDQQEAWMRSMVAQHGNSDPFWAHAGNLLAQLDGLIAGYATAARQGVVPHLDEFTFKMLSASGDVGDIVPAVSEHDRIDWMKLSREEAERLHSTRGHCSGLIKLTPDFSDIFMAHSTWMDYRNTNRIFKHYFLNFSNPATASRKLSFSSYPGFLVSQDDFYLLESGLGWIQTSNSVVNHSAYNHVKPESLLAWQRARIASTMATSGKEWYEYFRRHFSGTYINQYMVVDFKRFTPHQPIRSGLLWVVEEMPGLLIGGDKSTTLAQGYWPSYNVPFWSEIYERSGFNALALKHGTFFTYELSPRAQIFRRDQGTVVDMHRLKSFMRYNDFSNDPFSSDSTGQRNPMHTICARGDLLNVHPSTSGCYDSKVTSYKYGSLQLRAQAINGPTQSRGHGNLPSFSWADGKFASERHEGLPLEYSFDFVDVSPKPLQGFSVAGQEGIPESSRIIYM
eukprot:TRINITY_DN14870_c0_g3_i2.p1 TRINITY_DN14870_c0_g3~~TRINITY_DN14870_c0_g3_i2.p1  ORF type:complete len:578 (+),score=72.87 TRINITY_DN14870_c0_g3_i2:112-1845(+)